MKLAYFFIGCIYYIYKVLAMSRKNYSREWQKLNKNVLTREQGGNAVSTASVFETTSETTTVLHAELTDQSDYLFGTNDSIDKNLFHIDGELDYPLLSENEDTDEDAYAIEIKLCEELRTWYGKQCFKRGNE